MKSTKEHSERSADWGTRLKRWWDIVLYLVLLPGTGALYIGFFLAALGFLDNAYLAFPRPQGYQLLQLALGFILSAAMWAGGGAVVGVLKHSKSLPFWLLTPMTTRGHLAHNARTRWPLVIGLYGLLPVATVIIFSSFAREFEIPEYQHPRAIAHETSVDRPFSEPESQSGTGQHPAALIFLMLLCYAALLVPCTRK
ncbi:MAG: hypothetical protein GY851_12145 [bacterium]|nr:hypothetical protein [bacterium]